MDAELMPMLSQQLVQRWGMSSPDAPALSGADTAALRQLILSLLTARVEALLRDDFEFLVNAMYRLDVPEHRFHACMALGTPEQIAPALAQVILDRELLRLETWRKYSGKS